MSPFLEDELAVIPEQQEFETLMSQSSQTDRVRQILHSRRSTLNNIRQSIPTLQSEITSPRSQVNLIEETSESGVSDEPIVELHDLQVLAQFGQNLENKHGSSHRVQD